MRARGAFLSSHKLLLDYLRRFGVAVEIYVMASESNLTHMQGGPYRGQAHRQPPAHSQHARLDRPDGVPNMPRSCSALSRRTKMSWSNCARLMVTFGDLTTKGCYVVGTAKPGQDDTDDVSDRAGFDELPGIRPGEIAEAIQLDRLLASEYWKKTRFYQPVDFLWQPTLFQPVGGMDQVQRAFRQQVASLGGVVHLNSPVTRIDYDQDAGQFLISAAGHETAFRADYCFSNLAIPFLERILSPRLQAPDGKSGFSAEFKQALHAVYETQANADETRRFLACTTKVGWQADRTLWQGAPFHTHPDSDGMMAIACEHSEVGVVPIYGGISWTDHPITQIWYPSNAYHDSKGVLTGAYNFAENAARFGRMTSTSGCARPVPARAIQPEVRRRPRSWRCHRVAEHGSHQRRLGAMELRRGQRAPLQSHHSGHGCRRRQ